MLFGDRYSVADILWRDAHFLDDNPQLLQWPGKRKVFDAGKSRGQGQWDLAMQD